MNKKLFVRLLCALLSVLTLVAIVPAMAISASAYELNKDYGSTNVRWTKGLYENEAEYLAEMTLYYSGDTYELYCDETAGVVAYRNKLTGETMWTNPWNVNEGISSEVEEGKGQSDLDTEQAKLPKDFGTEKNEMLSQIVLKYEGSGGGTVYSYSSAAKEGQISVVPIKNGVRVEYAIGPLSPRILAPERIEQTSFEKNIMEPLKEGLIAEFGKSDGTWYFNKFMSYYRLIDYTGEKREVKREALARDYPVLAEKNINMYMLGDDILQSKDAMREEIEKKIKKYCSYTLEMMDEDYEYLNYESVDSSPPVFKMALEYVIDENGLSVTLPANGLRYDESTYKITELWVLPYMGASLCTNEGYSFVADGSGVLFELGTADTKSWYVYGDDYALQDESDGGNMHTKNHQIMRMPVYGQVETIWSDALGNVVTKAEYEALADKTGYTSTSRGYMAIIEEGDALARVQLSQQPGVYRYSLLKTTFTTRQKDKFSGGWSAFATRRYVDNYKIRYVMLNDDTKADQAHLSNYYECSWMGMACAYRDYLDAKDNGFERLTSADISDSAIPLYIETFGCVDTIEKVLSMPVTVSKALTTFDDVATMYDYLCANGVKNVNFKLTGYANGGLYSDVPYKLKWESSVGGANGFEDLVEKAKTEGFGIYPDFNFVYTTHSDGGSKVNMKKHAARTVFNRYTTKRVYSSTYQAFVSYYQMVMAPATYAHFYEKLSDKYEKYDASGISLGTFGSALNSDYDEEKLSLREDTKQYIMQGLDYFKNQNYDVMVDAGNAFTWGYVDHILGVPLDSSRYSAEMTAVPFAGMVLHGYKQFTSTALNKEGNISYAVLKAMESGASVYFILSYANTELLKEDEVLSQNYSVRYDIWQERLVEIYLELNSVLADVQTKLIVNHEVLNLMPETNTQRVPDQDELLKDIEAEAQKKKEQIEQKIEKERLAKLEAVRTARSSAMNAVTEMTKALAAAQAAVVDMEAQLAADSALMTKIAAAADAAEIEAVLMETVVASAGELTGQFVVAHNELLAAKAGYDFLKTADVAVELVNEAKDNLDLAIQKFVEVYAVVGFAVTVDSTWAESDAQAIDTLITCMTPAASGMYVVVEQIQTALTTAGYTTIDLMTMVNDEVNAKGAGLNQYQAIVIAPVVMDEVVGNAPNYKVDNNVVAVTYGESKNDPSTYYKTLLLNFNDYTIYTEYNGVTYTIAAYDYVVIKY